MGSHLIKIIYSLILLASLPGASAADLVSLESCKQHKLVADYLGVYLRGSPSNPDAIALVEFNQGWLRIWNQVGNIPCGTFAADLSQEIKVEYPESYGGSRYRRVETQLQLNSKNLLLTKTSTGRFRREVEVFTLSLDNSILTLQRRRSYFKKKYGFVGPWIEDSLSYESQLNSLDYTWRLLKLTNQPMALDDFFERTRQISNSYVMLTVPVEGRLGVEDAIEQGHFVEVFDSQLPGAADLVSDQNEDQTENQRGQVIEIDFSARKNCEASLKSPGSDPTEI